MKHLLLILAAVVLSYAFWTIADKAERKFATKFATRHGLRLGFIVLVVLLLLWAAAHLPSTQLL